ncbi:protein SHORT ROOT IN SALT MEDIUM 1-like [Rosa rugosa]|uniref:protein SHORT ROOT IN SALT MEDIUM 1-like n=1 Tax=Rosa rugosa TaxID=74645 RepID=UPI002B410FE5|nr:protein SHORT ROOT IN SALT MEDIUM 1-like [Rosa rugosa]
MTISGPRNSTDGGDPSVDDSSLIQTAIRYGKDVAKHDLQNCKNWNRFLKDELVGSFTFNPLLKALINEWLQWCDTKSYRFDFVLILSS